MASYLVSLRLAVTSHFCLFQSGLFGGGSSSSGGGAAANNNKEGESSGGLMSSIFSKGAKMASKAVGGSPEANLELTAPPDQRLYFVNGDEISGALSIQVPNEIQH